MGGGTEDEAEAPTLAQTAPDRTSRPSVAKPLSVGAVVGRYVLARRLGAGAMGIVWQAHDPQLDRAVAIKLVHPSLARSEEHAERFLREARAMAKLSHRAVVTVHDAGEADGQLFIAMELVEGTTLGAMLRERDAASIADWRRWLGMLVEAGRGLEAAHAGGVLHRDFKPDNVLVAASGRVCVGDFGLATLGEQETLVELVSRRESKTALDLTTTGALLGTPAYMSPQALRGEAIDARTDQFSFCVAAWEAVYASRPFVVEGTGLEAIVELTDRIDAFELPSAPEGSTVPDAVRDVLVRGLSPDPTKRWPDMRAMLDALEEAMRSARRAPTQARAPARGSRRRLVLAIGAASVLAIAAIVAAFALGRRGTHAPPPSQTPVAAPSSAGEPKRLFGVAMRTGLAMSPDGTKIALNSDRLQVRAIDGRELASTLLPTSDDEVTQLELDDTELYFATRRRHALFRWSFTTQAAPVEVIADLGGYWQGRTRNGHVVWSTQNRRMFVLRDGKRVAEWDTPNGAEQLRMSPDRTRLAFIESSRFRGRIVVHSVDDGREVAAISLESPTSVAWIDDTTLLFGTGIVERPTIYRVTIGPEGFGTPERVWGLEHGWFGPIAAHGDQMLVIRMNPTPRPNLLRIVGDRPTSRDLDHASATLGWLSSTEFLAWSRNTGRVERRGLGGPLELTGIELAGEPASATTAGDIVIAALRGSSGRETVATSITSGTPLWSHPDRRTVAVRCANDRQPPCFAIRTHDHWDEVRPIDPTTGALGSPIYMGRYIEDLAVDAKGERILVAGNLTHYVREIDARGVLHAAYDIGSFAVRSVAWDPRGGFLYGGTVLRNLYQVARYEEGKRTPVLQSDDDLLSFVRPSPDGTHLLVVSRVFNPEVLEVSLPTRSP